MFDRLRLWLRALLRRSEVERELDDELGYHVEMLTKQNVRLGMTPEDARYAALASFEGLEQSKEQCRDAWGVRIVQDLSADARVGARILLRRPGFTSIVILTLALGIGANTAVFSVVSALLLRPLPVDEPDRLVWVWGRMSRGDTARVSPPDFVDFRSQNGVFEQLAAYSETIHVLAGGAEPERLRGAMVTADFFEMMRTAPVLGRTFRAEDEAGRKPVVAILGNGLWQRRFGADRSVIGRTIQLDGRGVTVVGVMPAGFAFPNNVDLWVPTPFDADEMQVRKAHFLRPIGRLGPGVTLPQAQAAMDAIARRLEEQYPTSNSGWSVRLEPLGDVVLGDVRLPLLVLAGAVGLVLLVACANIANLLLARASSRKREITVRAALGASRLRIVRQLVTESFLLAFVGGTLGLLLAYWGTRALAAQLPDEVTAFIPGPLQIGIDGRVLAFTAVVSILTGLVVGILPAIQASRPNLTDALKEGGRSSSEGVYRNRVRNLLVVAEIAVSVVLLIGAGLLVRSLLTLFAVDPGLDAENVLTMRIELSSPKYAETAPRAAYFEEALSRVASIPGVESAATINALPLAPGQGGDTYFTIPGRPPENPNDRPVAQFRRVSDEYFQTMGIPVLEGRSFTAQEVRDAAPVVIVNEAMARRYLPDVDPIGQRVEVDMIGKIVSCEIVGVVGNVRQYTLESESLEEMYVPTLAAPFTNLVVRTSGDPLGYAPSIRRELLRVDGEQPVANIKPMTAYLEESTASRRLNVLLLGLFAGVALLLAAIGIYGMVAYMVAQRTHEIGIRMALGARRASVLLLVLRQGFALTAAGVVFGVAAALALSQVMTSLLYGVSATDVLTFATVPGLLAVVALVACYVPARRAISVDPVVALRSE